jgi:uridine kinase
MKGDSIVVEKHHVKAAKGIVAMLLQRVPDDDCRVSISVAGQSGSGKSETSTALANELAAHDISSVIFQQDDYFVYPPKTNDRTRRADIAWVGPQEVRLDLLDQHILAFLDGAARVEKPLVDYEADAVLTETMDTGAALVAIVDGTYTTLLENVNWRVFIDRDYRDTRAHREKRKRDESELDPFIERVLEIEHGIISAHRKLADIIVNKDYSVSLAR